MYDHDKKIKSKIIHRVHFCEINDDNLEIFRLILFFSVRPTLRALAAVEQHT